MARRFLLLGRGATAEVGGYATEAAPKLTRMGGVRTAQGTKKQEQEQKQRRAD